MTEPWFDSMFYAWIPGTVLGTVGGVLGSVAGICAPKGIGKIWVLGLFVAMILAGLGLLLAGVVALFSGQPYGVWYGLLLPGVTGVLIFGSLLPVVWMRYREAELRKMNAENL